MPVEVPEAVLRAFTEVRDSGVVNMLDRNGVAQVLDEFGYTDAKDWLQRNAELYSRGVFIGFVASEGDSE